ncbi:hypothetical protein [Paramicrobacterium fandaimingii]|uniref:hypothetical protein n=1 Tax=Paramicrobacterium fandaimingii TaxID=2708079 RepID=UPI0014209082|nr:hypothetical protein [Microbacterium fandaimingii]
MITTRPKLRRVELALGALAAVLATISIVVAVKLIVEGGDPMVPLWIVAFVVTSMAVVGFATAHDDRMRSYIERAALEGLARKLVVKARQDGFSDGYEIGEQDGHRCERGVDFEPEQYAAHLKMQSEVAGLDFDYGFEHPATALARNSKTRSWPSPPRRV